MTSVQIALPLVSPKVTLLYVTGTAPVSLTVTLVLVAVKISEDVAIVAVAWLSHDPATRTVLPFGKNVPLFSKFIVVTFAEDPG